MNIDALRSVAGELARELFAVSGRPVEIHFGDNVERTHAGAGEQLVVTVDMAVVGAVKKMALVETVFKGLAYREFAHKWHLDMVDAYASAQEQGFGHVFYLLHDELCIRDAISEHPTWGDALQAVARHLFPRNSNKSARLAEVRVGNVTVNPPAAGTVAATAEYAKRWSAFAYHLRRAIDVNASTPKSVVTAVGFAKIAIPVPPRKLQNVAKTLHYEIAEGIVADVVVKPAAQRQSEARQERVKDTPVDAPVQEPEKAPAAKEEEASEPVITIGKEDPSFWKSPWLWGTLVAGTAAWTGVWLRTGDTFLTVIMCLLSIAVLAAVVGVHFWKEIGSLLGTGFRFIGNLISEAVNISIRKPVSAIAKAGRTPAAKKAFAWVGGAALLAVVIVLFQHAQPKYLFLVISVLGLALCYKFVPEARSAEQNKSVTDKEQKGLMALLEGQQKGLVALLGGLMFVFSVMFAGSTALLLDGFGWSWLAIAGASLVVWGVIMILSGSILLKAIDNTTDKALSSIEQFYAGIELIGRSFFGLLGTIWQVFIGALVAVKDGFVSLLRALRDFLVDVVHAFAKMLRRIGLGFEPTIKAIWSSVAVRLAAFAAVPGFLIAGIIALVRTLLVEGSTSWPLLIALTTLLIVVGVLLIAFREKIGRIVFQRAIVEVAEFVGVDVIVCLDTTTRGFTPMELSEEPVLVDRALLAKVSGSLAAPAAIVRSRFDKLGKVSEREYGVTAGFDVRHAERALHGDLGIFVNSKTAQSNQVFLAVALDCSHSMLIANKHFAGGQKFERGRMFGLVLDQALAGVSSVRARFFGFNDGEILDCGVAGDRKISGLKAERGNNDTGTLRYMREQAKRSGKEIKIIVMISDIQPEGGNSWLSLQEEVAACERDGITVIFARVDASQTVPGKNVVNLFGQSLEGAASDFGRLIDKIGSKFAEAA
jgi:hypothetical protein